jgi:hypothetical protein
MARLAPAIVEAITIQHGPTVVLERLSDPLWITRRHHWLGAGMDDFVCEPHAAILSDRSSQLVLDFTAGESTAARAASAELAREGPRGWARRRSGPFR